MQEDTYTSIHIEEFDIEIPDEDAEKLETVSDAIEYLNKRLSE